MSCIFRSYFYASKIPLILDNQDKAVFFLLIKKTANITFSPSNLLCIDNKENKQLKN